MTFLFPSPSTLIQPLMFFANLSFKVIRFSWLITYTHFKDKIFDNFSNVLWLVKLGENPRNVPCQNCSCKGFILVGLVWYSSVTFPLSARAGRVGNLVLVSTFASSESQVGLEASVGTVDWCTPKALLSIWIIDWKRASRFATLSILSKVKGL